MVEITKATPIDLIKLMTPFITSISKDYISLIKGALEIDGATRLTCVQLIVENKEYFKTKVSTPENFKQWLNEELIGS
jgi:hypothetical protein